jgi:hypothetical protein
MKMKKFVLACAMLLATVTASAACPAEAGCAVVLKASDGYWNVRAAPNGKILMRVHRGDTVEIVDAKGNWTYVAVHDSDIAGWISSNGLQEMPCH